MITLTSSGVSSIPLNVKGFVAQTGNLVNWTNSSDVLQGGFTAKSQLLAFGPTNNVTTVAIGTESLNSNVSAVNNTAVGYRSLKANTGSSSATAFGYSALSLNAAPSGNVAIGAFCNSSATAGSSNAIVGGFAFQNQTSGNNNTGLGAECGKSLLAGSGNVLIGRRTGWNTGANGNFSNNTFLGANTGTNITTGASSNILIGQGIALPTAGGSNQLSIGDIIFGTGINAATGMIGIHQPAPTAFLDLPASTTARATLRLRTGSEPTSPNDGDVWQDGTDLKIRINGVTKTVTVT